VTERETRTRARARMEDVCVCACEITNPRIFLGNNTKVQDRRLSYHKVHVISHTHM